MPVYEFVCNKCKNKFELLRPFSRSSECAKCPVCQNQAGRIMSTCISLSTNTYGVKKQVSGGSSCSSCSSGNCSSCGS